jgi:hypothetical protein
MSTYFTQFCIIVRLNSGFVATRSPPLPPLNPQLYGNERIVKYKIGLLNLAQERSRGDKPAMGVTDSLSLWVVLGMDLSC